jgi:hypothetical protein
MIIQASQALQVFAEINTDLARARGKGNLPFIKDGPVAKMLQT